MTSEGLFEISPALVKSIEYEDKNGKIVRLEELCLRGNRLDTGSLPQIARIISLASYDLRDLDLSDNLITITSDEEVATWEDFLISFSNCCVLRRIDLSGNALGCRAFEVLARVYAMGNPVDLAQPDAIDQSHKKSTRSWRAVSQGGDEFVEQARRMSVMERGSPGIETAVIDHAEKPSSSANHAEPLHIYATTRGLRSVPYLIFSNTGMTEICAVQLSYILACHNIPEKLLTHVPAAKAGPQTQQLLAYSENGCRGIIFLPNNQLGGAAMKVLDLSEAVREGLSEDVDQEERPGDIMPTPRSATAARKLSDTATAAGRRRSNVYTGSATDQGKHGNKICISAELDRARSRIQGNFLEKFGPQSNDLWRTALKMLTLCRDIHPVADKKQAAVGAKRPETLPEAAPRTSKPRPLSVTPLAAKNPNQNLTVPFGGQWRLDNSRLVPVTLPVKPGLTVVTKTAPPLPIPHSSPSTPPTTTRTDSTEPELPTNPYRSKLPCGFSEDVWRQIMATAAGAEGIMSETQQRSVLRWAMDCGTLSKEKMFLGLKESAQIWKVLDGMGCLAYEMRN